MKRAACLAAVATMLIFTFSAFAYTVPQDSSRVKYFYVFGPQGNPLLGAETPVFILYIDVPHDALGAVTVSIYDPDTVGSHDLRVSLSKPWNTVTEFAVYGKDNALLGQRQFGAAREYDRRYYTFGPYPKEVGEWAGPYYRFKLVVTAKRGEDENLFNVRITPESAEAFTHKITFRLLDTKGEKMYFYPLLTAGTTKLIVENYDIDPTGGRSVLFDPESKIQYAIRDSASGQWAQTVIPVTIDQTRSLEYVVTKRTQIHGNAGLRFWNDKGESLPIYFKPGKTQPLAIAEAVSECNNTFTFDATSSFDPENMALSYLWDFGDGETSDLPVVTHTYAKGGEYRVRLTVKNTSGLECDTAYAYQILRINTLPAVEFSAPDRVCVGQEANFDASATDDNTPDTLTYKWDFGDGTNAEGKIVSKTYKLAGVYNVKLTVDDNENTACSSASQEKAISVLAPPVADAGEDIDMCLAANQQYRVVFDAKESSTDLGRNLQHSWDFGDGETGIGKSVTHVYKEAGTYNVTLTVDDGLGLECSSDQDSLVVTLNRQPVANAGPNLVCCINKVSIFDGSASYDPDGDALTYKWDFGDGTAAEGVRVEHAYSQVGKYTVTLTVKDDSGKSCDTATSSFTAQVNDRPVSVMEVR